MLKVAVVALLLAAVVLHAQNASAKIGGFVDIKGIKEVTENVLKGVALFLRLIQIVALVVPIAVLAWNIVTGQGLPAAVGSRWFTVGIVMGVVIIAVHAAFHTVAPFREALKYWISLGECPLIICPS